MLLGLAENRQYLGDNRYLGDYRGVSISNIKLVKAHDQNVRVWRDSYLTHL